MVFIRIPGMRWSTALLGWRTLFGGTVFGWHDNVKTDAGIFIAKQITQSNFTAPHADPKTNLTSQAPDSRMFGKGTDRVPASAPLRHAEPVFRSGAARVALDG